MPRPALLTIVFLLACSNAFFSKISNASDFHSARTAGLAGSGHAGAMLNDSIYLNPSYAAFLPTYSLATNFQTFSYGTPDPAGDSPLHGRVFNVSLQDGRSELFQAGFAYTRRENGNLISIGAAKAAAKNLGIGLGAKFFLPHKAPSDLSGTQLVSDFIFSSTLIANNWFQAVAVVDNLKEDDLARANGFYREYILGTKFNMMGVALFYFDPHIAPHAPEVKAGDGSYGHEMALEMTPFTDLFFRVGHFFRSAVPQLNQRGSGYSAGAGWLGPRLSVDYAISRVVVPEGSTTHNFGATIYF